MLQIYVKSRFFATPWHEDPDPIATAALATTTTMSFIDWLPNEILSQICINWLWTVVRRHPSSNWIYFLPLVGGLLVSRRWNALLNSTPELWSTVVIPFPTPPSAHRRHVETWHRALQHAHRCLSASAALPLTLVMTYVRWEDTPFSLPTPAGPAGLAINKQYKTLIHSLLADSAPRIENVIPDYIGVIPEHVVQHIRECLPQFPNLHRCFLNPIKLNVGRLGVVPAGLLSRAPNLQHLAAGCQDHIPSLLFLRTADVELSEQRLLELFGSAPALEGIFANITKRLVTNTVLILSHVFQHPIQLASLTTIALAWRVGLLIITDLPAMPVLREAFLDARTSSLESSADVEREQLDAIGLFLGRHSATLRRLILSLSLLNAGQEAIEDYILSALPHLPQLEYLGLAMKIFNTLETWKRLTRMGAERNPLDPSLLPILSTFHLVVSLRYTAEELNLFAGSKDFQQWGASRISQRQNYLLASRDGQVGTIIIDRLLSVRVLTRSSIPKKIHRQIFDFQMVFAEIGLMMLDFPIFMACLRLHRLPYRPTTYCLIKTSSYTDRPIKSKIRFCSAT